jgi:hypothetical protein
MNEATHKFPLRNSVAIISMLLIVHHMPVLHITSHMHISLWMLRVERLLVLLLMEKVGWLLELSPMNWRSPTEHIRRLLLWSSHMSPKIPLHRPLAALEIIHWGSLVSLVEIWPLVMIMMAEMVLLVMLLVLLVLLVPMMLLNMMRLAILNAVLLRRLLLLLEILISSSMRITYAWGEIRLSLRSF